MRISSPAFEEGGHIPNKYGKLLENESPPLRFHDVPSNSSSLVLVVDDPDSKKVSGKIWDHWIVWNIDPKVSKFPENKVVDGQEGINDFGERGWGGPNPPDKAHEYRFILYAVDVKLNISEDSNKDSVYSAIRNHVIEKSDLRASYSPVS